MIQRYISCFKDSYHDSNVNISISKFISLFKDSVNDSKIRVTIQRFISYLFHRINNVVHNKEGHLLVNLRTQPQHKPRSYSANYSVLLDTKMRMSFHSSSDYLASIQIWIVKWG